MNVKQNTKTIFLGTPDFAATSLQALYDLEYEIIGVFTQPDRPSGRGQQISKSAVKNLAESLGLPMFYPETKAELTALVTQLHPDLAIVAAYGIIIEQAALDVPEHGFINVHGSLLPKYRGASPIAEVILQGESSTGITIMHMDAGMDTGAIIKEFPLDIETDDTTASLTGKMATLGASAITEVIPAWIAGNLTETAQEEADATYCKKISKTDAHIDWQESAEIIARKVRAYYPWPKAYTSVEGTRFQLLQALVSETTDLRPGEISFTTKETHIGTGSGDLNVLRIQPESKNPISGKEFVNNYPGLDSKKAI